MCSIEQNKGIVDPQKPCITLSQTCFVALCCFIRRVLSVDSYQKQHPGFPYDGCGGHIKHGWKVELEWPVVVLCIQVYTDNESAQLWTSGRSHTPIWTVWFSRWDTFRPGAGIQWLSYMNCFIIAMHGWKDGHMQIDFHLNVYRKVSKIFPHNNHSCHHWSY